MTRADGGDLTDISGVVATLPAGYSLGERRMFNGDIYRLVYNTSNQQVIPGYLVCANVGSALAAGPYSCTITTTTEVCKTVVGAVKHATATTATYFWALTETLVNPVTLSGVTAIASNGVYILPAANGQITNGTTTSIIGYSTAGAKFYISLETKTYSV